MIRQLMFSIVFACAASTFAAPPFPKPVAAWASGPLEARIVLEAPLDDSPAKSLVGRTITFRETEPADSTSTKGTLNIAGARLTEDRKTLILATDPHPLDATYQLNLGSRTVTYSLHGVDVTWTAADGAEPTWSGWWPGLDAAEMRRLAKFSSEHARLLPLLSQPGTLRIRGILTLPEGKHALRINTSGVMDATIGDAAGTPGDAGAVNVDLDSTGEAADLDVTIATAPGTSFALTIATAGGAPIPNSSLLVPWAPIAPFVPDVPSQVPDLAGGDPVKGEQVYNSETAKCASCHKINGKGGDVGPDLTNQADRDLAAIYRDINEPSATIHPDYVQYIVATKDGQVLAGIVRAEGEDAVKVIDATSKTSIIPRSEIEDLRPGSASLMPVGLAGAIGEERMKDLVVYLRRGGKPAATPK